MIKYLITFFLIASPCLAGMGIGGFPQPGPGPGVVLGGGITAFDDFNRSDGALGSNWAQAGSWAMPTIVSQTIKGVNSENNMARWVGDTFGDDHKVTVKLTTPGNAGDACVRVSSTANTGYCVKYQSSTELRIVRIINGSENLLQSYAQSTTSDDTISISAVGTTLTAFMNGSALSPTVSDSSITSGQPGVYIWSDSVRLDDFSAEEL